MMDPKLKAEWVAALRSGNYTQAKGALAVFPGTAHNPCKPDKTKPPLGYCCLGVLCKVKGLSNEEIDYLNDHTNSLGFEPEWEDEETGRVYPAEGDEDGISKDMREKLAAMNDGDDVDGQPTRPRTFAEIADYIEENL